MTHPFLHARAELLGQLRRFFISRGFAEVQTPIAANQVIPERYIELFQTSAGSFLQASPEMAMKQLLCAGSGPIFQIGPAFRAEEAGTLHAPEFTMVEWYRPGDNLQDGMHLLAELVQATLAANACQQTSYREAFLSHAGVDPFDALAVRSAMKGFEPDNRLPSGPNDTDDLLNVLLAQQVEPALGCNLPELLYHYPASQSALATTTTDVHGNAVAERFELYYQGVELANGYHELTDPAELRQRLTLANDKREADGRRRLPMPETLLSLMQTQGLPACAGVALGFDRLLMLKVGAASIAEVM